MKTHQEIETARKNYDASAVPTLGAIRFVQGYAFEVVAIHPEETSPCPVAARRGTFTGKALSEALIGTGYDGGSYAY